VIAYDVKPNPTAAAEHGITYVPTLSELLQRADIVSLHCPLMESTHHLLNDETFPMMKRGVVLVNASRGGLIDTRALIRSVFCRTLQIIANNDCSSLKSGHIGAVSLDGKTLECFLYSVVTVDADKTSSIRG
jgi:hypothetical protein